MLHLLLLYTLTTARAFDPLSCEIQAKRIIDTLKWNRRHALSGFAALGLLPSQARAGEEAYKDLSTKISSKLLTSAETASEDALGAINWAAPKVTGLSTEEMAKRIDAGLRRECWFITGRSLPELFADSFTFSDPQVVREPRDVVS